MLCLQTQTARFLAESHWMARTSIWLMSLSFVIAYPVLARSQRPMLEGLLLALFSSLVVVFAFEPAGLPVFSIVTAILLAAGLHTWRLSRCSTSA